MFLWNRYLISASLLVLVSISNNWAQKISITISGLKTDSSLLYLEGYYGKDKFPIDSFQMQNAHTQTTELPQSRSGVYALRLADGPECLFASGPDGILNMQLTYSDMMRGNIKVINSPENEAFKKFTAFKNNFENASDSLEAIGLNIDEFDPKYEARSDSVRDIYIGLCTKFNDALTELAGKYPSTYTAKFLIPMLLVPLPDSLQQQQFDNLKSFNHRFFFENMPMFDNGVIANPYFEDEITNYLSLYTHHRDEEKLKEDLIFLQDSLTGNPEVQEFIRYALLKYYLRKGPESITNFLTGLSATEGCENSSPFQTNQAVKNLLAIAPGKPAPQLSIKDYYGSPRSLSGVLYGKKAGVILFWASWCSHCRDTVPVFYQWYQKYRDKGLEVYAVSLDYDPQDWHSFTQSFTPDWVNVSELKGWDSESVSTYSIRATPSFIAVDENRNIILKTSYLRELKDALELLLK